MQRLRDFDRVFGLLDGRFDPEKGFAPEYGLVDAFTNDASELAAGCRISTSYFDVRWFPGVGSVHFFPKSKSLMDAMNRFVGRERQWIPSERHEASADFWKQYDFAESFDREVRAEVNKTVSGRTYWGGPIEQMMRGRDEDEASRAAEGIDKAMEAVQIRHGLDIDNLLDHVPAQLRLAA